MGQRNGRPWIEVGTRTDVAAMFACPGRLEEAAGGPAEGQTGTNYATVLGILQSWGVAVPDRPDLTIDNAWDGVLYGKPSLPTKTQVRSTRNVQRLHQEIGPTTDWLFCFGKPALWAAEALRANGLLQPGCVPVFTYHLGMQGINQIKFDLGNQLIPTQEVRPDVTDQTFRRLEVVAAGMLGQMGMLSRVPRGDTTQWQNWLPRWIPRATR